MNFRAQLRKAARRANEIGCIRHRVYIDRAELEEQYSRFLDAEASGWKGTSGTAIKCSEDLTAFYANLAKYFGTSSACHLHFLEIGEVLVATEFALVVGDTAYSLKIGYVQRWAPISPGHLLSQRILEHYSKGSDVRFVNWVTCNEWQRVWNPLQYRVFRWQYFRPTVAGLLGLALFHTRRLLHCFSLVKITPVH